MRAHPSAAFAFVTLETRCSLMSSFESRKTESERIAAIEAAAPTRARQGRSHDSVRALAVIHEEKLGFSPAAVSTTDAMLSKRACGV